MRFSELDNKARGTLSPAERAQSDRRRAELGVQLRTGIAIRDAREAVGYTQTDLAGKLGIAQSALSRIEAGRTNLTLATLRRIAEALEVDLDLSFGGKGATTLYRWDRKRMLQH